MQVLITKGDVKDDKLKKNKLALLSFTQAFLLLLFYFYL